MYHLTQLMLLLVISLNIASIQAIVGVKFIPRKNVMGNCVDPSVEERTLSADVIFTATVFKLYQEVKVDDMYTGEVQVKRVYKGESTVSAIEGLNLDTRATRARSENYNKVVRITGLGDPDICVSSVRVRDTKVFFLKTDTEGGGDLRLSSSVIYISGYTLKQVDAAVNRKYVLANLYWFGILHTISICNILRQKLNCYYFQECAKHQAYGMTARDLVHLSYVLNRFTFTDKRLITMFVETNTGT